MTNFEAKQIGGGQGVISVIIGLIIIEILAIISFVSAKNSIVEGIFWFTDISDNHITLIGCPIIMIAFGYLYGQIAGVLILLKNRHYGLVGFLTGFTILVTTSFIAGCLIIIQDVIENEEIGWKIFEYLGILILIGTLPTFFIGIWFGRQVKRKTEVNK